MPVDYLSLISKHTSGEDPRTVPAFIIHSALVTKKALDVASSFLERHSDAKIDLRLLEEMGMLHDIGIFRVEEPMLFTHGPQPYLSHLTRGREILEEEGLPVHARAAIAHSGIPKSHVVEKELPLEHVDHLPKTSEEELLYLADQFFTKRFSQLFQERSLEQTRSYVEKHGKDRLAFFDSLWKKWSS